MSSPGMHAVLPDYPQELMRSSQKMHRRGVLLNAFSLGLVVAGAWAALIGLQLHRKTGNLALGPAFAGIALLGSVFVATALIEDRSLELSREREELAHKLGSLAWLYAIGGHPFAVHYNIDVATRLYSQRFSEIFGTRGDLVVGTIRQPDSPAITDWMSSTRSNKLSDRVHVYRRERLEAEQDKLAQESDRLRGWLLATRRGARAISMLALIAALCQALELFHIDFIGALSASAAGLLAWQAIRRFETSANQKALVAGRLTVLIAESGAINSESEWTAFAERCERILDGIG